MKIFFSFHFSVLMSFIIHFNTKADILMERLRSLADGKTVFQLFPELNHITLDAISVVSCSILLYIFHNKLLNNTKKN